MAGDFEAGDAAAAADFAGAAGPAAAADDDPRGYAFAADARPVRAATGTTDAALLRPGSTYRSTLPADGTAAHYRLDLDATSNAYVSATAVPDPAAPLAASDGIKVSVQNTDSRSCSYDTATIGGSRSPRPLTATGAREADGPLCEGAGTYYVVVERVGPGRSGGTPWELEIGVSTEPRLAQAAASRAPEAWDSASPAPPTDEPRRRPGGAGFDTAAPLGQGVWTAGITPGQTLFYEIPVDWGQRPYATAELGSAGGTDHSYAVAALRLSLHNPVRALVDDDGTGYDGRQQSATLAPLPPVDFANRYASADRVSGMRFAGSYYLVVHLAAQVAEKVGPGPFGLTLRVRVQGDAQDGPLYAGRSVPQGLFDVTGGEREAASGESGGGGAAMAAVAVGGFGAGTLILVGLAVWAVRARRLGAGGALRSG
ncbi:hypothetical protein AB0K92_08420 [Streptomyces sp. NPDC052687]|uniref:hypothetical protein n=1 Tax=Streptomyces sp. NPDC052687 TaxID=3154759 RepID=UPI003427E0E1